MFSINFLLISIVSYLGLFAGYFALSFCPEEKKPGMKYFKVLHKVVFGISIVAAVYFSWFNLMIVILSIVFLIGFFYLKEYRIYIAYMFYALVIALVGSIVPFATIVFSYGLILGAIIFEPKKNNVRKLFLPSYYILISNIITIIL